MKVLIISDGHGDLARLDEIAPVAEKCDFVLYGGDFARFGHPETGKPFLDRLAKLHDQVFAVTGNCDAPDFRDEVEAADLSVEGSLAFFSGLLLAGSGGAARHRGLTPNERDDAELAADLRLAAGSAEPEDVAEYRVDDEDDSEEDAGGSGGVALAAEASRETEGGASEADSGDRPARENLVIIAHHPPKDTLLDVLPGGAHAGSPSIRAFIEAEKPLLAVSGHIHESPAIDRIGPSTLVNPGALYEGRYALAEIVGGKSVPFSVASVTLERL